MNQAPKQRSSSSEGHARAAALTPLGAVVWLLATAVVGILGVVLLEGARVTAPARLAPALVIVLPLELVCYLLALQETRGPRLRPVRTALGVFLGLIIRASLTLILGLVRASPLAGGGGLASQFLLFYARLWPAALVQMLAVAAYLWLIRDLLAGEPLPEAYRPALPWSEEPAEQAERQKELLSALLEPAEEEQTEVQLDLELKGKVPVSPPADRPSLRRRTRRKAQEPAPQPSLISEEAPAPAPEALGRTSTATPEEPGPEDTAALPQVSPPPEQESSADRTSGPPEEG